MPGDGSTLLVGRPAVAPHRGDDREDHPDGGQPEYQGQHGGNLREGRLHVDDVTRLGEEQHQPDGGQDPAHHRGDGSGQGHPEDEGEHNGHQGGQEELTGQGEMVDEQLTGGDDDARGDAVEGQSERGFRGIHGADDAARSGVPARPGGKGRHLGARADIAVEVGHGSPGRAHREGQQVATGARHGTEVVDGQGEDARRGPGAPGGDLPAVEGDGVVAGGRHPQEPFGAPGGKGDVRRSDQALCSGRSGQGRGSGRAGERIRRDGDRGCAGSRRGADSRHPVAVVEVALGERSALGELLVGEGGIGGGLPTGRRHAVDLHLRTGTDLETGPEGRRLAVETDHFEPHSVAAAEHIGTDVDRRNQLGDVGSGVDEVVGHRLGGFDLDVVHIGGDLLESLDEQRHGLGQGVGDREQQAEVGPGAGLGCAHPGLAGRRGLERLAGRADLDRHPERGDHPGAHDEKSQGRTDPVAGAAGMDRGTPPPHRRRRVELAEAERLFGRREQSGHGVPGT